MPTTAGLPALPTAPGQLHRQKTSTVQHTITDSFDAAQRDLDGIEFFPDIGRGGDWLA